MKTDILLFYCQSRAGTNQVRKCVRFRGPNNTLSGEKYYPDKVEPCRQKVRGRQVRRARISGGLGWYYNTDFAFLRGLAPIPEVLSSVSSHALLVKGLATWLIFKRRSCIYPISAIVLAATYGYHRKSQFC